jgi:hypothetical protein
MDQNALFQSLVRNAIDFFEQAIGDVERNPKYSVIHFFAGLEILLKSRLLLEHWTLVYDEPQNANPDKFIKGDFKSVAFDESIRRLRTITKTPISIDSERSFHRLRDHRNKLVHFFHPEYGPGADQKVVTEIVADVCAVWLHTYRLLTRTWRDAYTSFQEQFTALNKKMLRLRTFLQVKYDAIKPDLQKGIERGANILECPICGFQSAPIVNSFGSIIETKCLVCDDVTKRLNVSCPKCGAEISVYDMGQGTCKKCETSIDINYLISIFGVNQSPQEAMYEPAHAYCPNCEWVEQPTVVPFQDQFFCLNCLTTYDHIGRCEWCGELNAGDMSDSLLDGCVMCEGRYSWEN